MSNWKKSTFDENMPNQFQVGDEQHWTEEKVDAKHWCVMFSLTIECRQALRQMLGPPKHFQIAHWELWFDERNVITLPIGKFPFDVCIKQNNAYTQPKTELQQIHYDSIVRTISQITSI